MRLKRSPALALLFLSGLALTGLGVWLLLREVPSRPDRTPSAVVLVVMDALRADRVGGARNGVPLTPRLDAFSRGAALFENAAAACTWTRPSMASLFTSLHVDAHQVFHDDDPYSGGEVTADVLSESLDTMASYFQRHGYTTCGVQTNGNLEPQYGFSRGFDHYEYLPMASAEPVTDAALAALERAEGPLFLYVHYIDPHFPYDPPVEERSALGWPPALPPGEMEVVTDFVDYLWDHCEASVGIKAGMEHAPLSAGAREAVRLLYDGEVMHCDAQAGRLLGRTLEKYPDAVVVVTSDHGEHFWEHGQLAHGLSVYEEVLRVPLIIRGRGAPAGRQTAPASLVDVLPTMAALCGLPPEARWQGVSLLSGVPADRPLFTRNLGPWASFKIDQEAVVRDRIKLIVDRHAGRSSLHDLSLDPGEERDLSEEMPGVLAELTALLSAHERENARARTDTRRNAVIDEEARERLRGLGYVR